jgi:catechol 2,3-dioxygenase-like lactoylglutathione lyase family enzyme
MPRLALTALLVRDYDEAIDFYVGALGFELAEDTVLSPTKRWVVVRPAGSQGGLLLAKASGEVQTARVGDQTGGRVFLFLETETFDADYARMSAAGVRFLESPRREAYGSVVVFEDLYGNRWDLIGKA